MKGSKKDDAAQLSPKESKLLRLADDSKPSIDNTLNETDLGRLPATSSSVTPEISDKPGPDIAAPNDVDERAKVLHQMKKALEGAEEQPDPERLAVIERRIASGFYSTTTSRRDIVEKILADLLGKDPF